MLFKSGLVYSMTGDCHPDTLDVLIEGNRIVAVGKKLSADSCDRIIDCTGLIVLPGLIDSHCHIGVFGTAMGERGVDGNESSSPCTPHLRAIDGINPYDIEFRHSCEHGVTTVATGPGSANPICGQFVNMKTFGKTFDSRIINEPSAMKMAFGENPKTSHGGSGPVTRMGTAAVIREALLKAKRYAEDKKRAVRLVHEKGDEPVLPPFDIQLESLVPVVEGRLQVKAHAHRADDILTAIRIAKEFNLDMSIEHCSEGHLIPDELSYARGVILGPLIGFPHKLEVANQCPEAASILYAHGVNFAIMSDLPATHTWEILTAAGMCVRAGLPLLEGMKAVTVNAAQILGIDGRVGRLAPGYDADIAVFDSNPVESLQAHCLMTLVDGEIAFGEI